MLSFVFPHLLFPSFFFNLVLGVPVHLVRQRLVHLTVSRVTPPVAVLLASRTVTLRRATGDAVVPHCKTIAADIGNSLKRRWIAMIGGGVSVAMTSLTTQARVTGADLVVIGADLAMRMSVWIGADLVMTTTVWIGADLALRMSVWTDANLAMKMSTLTDAMNVVLAKGKKRVIGETGIGTLSPVFNHFYAASLYSSSLPFTLTPLHYSTHGRRRTWGPASQPGVQHCSLVSFLILLIPADLRSYLCSTSGHESSAMHKFFIQNAPCNHVFPNLFL